MKQGIRELEPHELVQELERLLLPRLIEVLRGRAPGHCMRISDLDIDLMVQLCGRLRAEVPSTEVVMLGTASQATQQPGLFVTSTRLVELRNPRPDGSLRPPLLVFVPPGMRASAEDSFGVATFEEISLGPVFVELRDRLLKELSNGVRAATVSLLSRLETESDPWRFATPLAQVRFLLTARVNGQDKEVFGAALYELGLVPDFELYALPDRILKRIQRNRQCMETLTWSSQTERGRVVELRLSSPELRVKLGNFLADTGVEDPRAWTRLIALDRAWWGLAFNRWEFEEDVEDPDVIQILEVSSNLPIVKESETDERLKQLIGQQILPVGKDGLRKFNVTFKVDPAPSRVEGLGKFTVQVISKERGPLGLARSKTAWAGNKAEATVSFSKLEKVEWEDGWHFIRVLAVGKDGELVPLVDSEGQSVPWSPDSEDPRPRSNESDLFYVLVDGEIEVDPPQRAVQREASLIHALTRLRFTALMEGRRPDSIALTQVFWMERKPSGRTSGDTIEVRFGREGTVAIPVSRTLKVLEQKILGAPDGPIAWRLPISGDGVGDATGELVNWPDRAESRSFLEARAAYFEALRTGSHELISRETISHELISREFISQCADFRSLKELIVRYAQTYLELVTGLQRSMESTAAELTQRTASDLRKSLAVDTVLLAMTDHRGIRREAALIAPTHPLRALWFLAWSLVCDRWTQHTAPSAIEFAVAARDALTRLLAPIAFPAVLPAHTGHLLTVIDNIHPFWTLYGPPSEPEPRGLLGDACEALGLEEPGIGGMAIDGAYLASRVQRYLVQHPYVRTLVINAFNAGRASILADMLMQLQRSPASSDIRYDIRLFVPDAEAPGVGEALLDLLSPSGRTSVREADAFSTVTESHLHPKLALAIRPATEFRADPLLHSAHLSFLFDIFPAGEVGASRARPEESGAPIHGLIQDFHVKYGEDEHFVTWSRQSRHGLAVPLSGNEEVSDLLSLLPAAMSSAIAEVATGEHGVEWRPVITLALGAEDRALLHQVHEVSDWVLTVDRNMGIEFFDHGGAANRPDYLIDHSPDMTGAFGHRLTISSRSVTELEAILCPVLAQYGLKAEGRHAVAILEQLRSLSGRLALKLISTPTQRAEALGLALSRMYLEHQGVFENQVVVPLDAHLNLYTVLKKSADELGDEVNFRRTDLALFDLDAARRTITCRLVEVKCYVHVGDLSAFHQLKSKIAGQIEQSESVLARHFDPHRAPVDRADRLLKTHELAALLEFYLQRSVRYGVMTDSAATEAQYFIRTLEDGYRLVFARAAIIFDFEKPGTEPPESEAGIEFHRIGIDLIRHLVEAAAPVAQTTSSAVIAEALDVTVEAAPSVPVRRERATSVPTLERAAFLAAPRERTVSWEQLQARRRLGEGDAPPTAADERAGSSEHVDPGVIGEAGSILNAVVQPIEVVPATPDLPETGGADMIAGGGSVGTGNVDAPDSGNVDAPVPLPSDSPKSTGVAAPPKYDVMLGVTSASPQYGILGEVSGRTLAFDLNQTHTISLFGVQGGGKSYTLGTVAEMASLPIEAINLLPKPLATVIFHYSPTMDYKPEFTSMVSPNSDAAQVASLRERYGAEPKALTDVILLVPGDKLDERRAEYPGIVVHPLKFAASELQASHWRFLMGAVGNQATYIRQLNRVMKSLRSDLTLEGLRQGLEASDLSDHLKGMAKARLALAAEYIDDSVRVASLIRPGRLIIVDLRDEFIEKDEALGLFVVLLQLFADARYEGQSYNKLVVFDEAHKYIESPDLVAGLIEVVREMRHKGTSIMVASQDPPSVPVALIELSSQIILHKFNSPAWLKHIQKANAALGGLSPDKMAQLRPGEAYVWSSKATDETFTKTAVKIRCRPRVTEHGGATKTAVEG